MSESDYRIADGTRHSKLGLKLKIEIWPILTLVWTTSTIICAIYMVAVYIIPLVLLTSLTIIPMKVLVEIIIFSIPILSSIPLTWYKINNEEIIKYFENDFFVIQIGKYLTATCCLDLTSVPGSVSLDSDNNPQYNTAMLLALRSGLDKRITITYEAGVNMSQPYLRLFISTTGNEISEIREVLRREATRTEAVLLASLNNVELSKLEGNDLKEAIFVSFDDNFVDTVPVFALSKKSPHQKILTLEGIPITTPTLQSSQIGTFISTSVRQGYSVRFICTFSRATPGRERRSLEGQWRGIREREKRSEDSLADQAAKKRLLRKFDEIQNNSGWFDTTTYIVVDAHPDQEIKEIFNGIHGLLLSIWGGDTTFKVTDTKITQRVAYRLLTRRHLKSQKIHVTRLAAFVNTPVQRIPVITPTEIPDFRIPSRELIDNEIPIGYAIFGGRRISRVGLKIDWIREHVTVLGATGTGKTTLVKHLISEMSKKTEIPWWIFDVKGSEYTDLVGNANTNIVVIRPGLDPSFVVDLLDSDTDTSEQNAYSTFIILRELLKERGVSSELSPAMERLLREAMLKLESLDKEERSAKGLIDVIQEMTDKEGFSELTRDALQNRLEILTRDPLGSIFSGGKNTIRISDLIERRVIFDLRYVARTGGMDAARLLYNLVAKRIFDCAMRRGIKTGLHHIVVLEEASNLVPESYTRMSAADVTTGESMVMLQRATGQGVIVIATRPNISSNILANTATKVMFRLPYDSATGARFLSLDEKQERYLRTLKRGRALAILPNTEAFEIATEPFQTIESYAAPLITDTIPEQETLTESEIEYHDETESSDSLIIESINQEPQTKVFDRIGEMANHIVAYLASNNLATEGQLHTLLLTIAPTIDVHDAEEIISDLVSLGTIEREAIPLVDGGFVFTLPGKGLEAIRKVIVDYIRIRLLQQHSSRSQAECPEGLDLVIDDCAIMILPEHLSGSSIESTLEEIRARMTELGNEVTELIVIVRGSVAAAKLREIVDLSAEFDAVNIVSAFPSSLEKMIDDLNRGRTPLQETPLLVEPDDFDESEGIIGAVHDVGGAANREIQMRLWFNLIQEFVEVSRGYVEWQHLLEFIETTAIQSLKGRSAPMNVDDGRRALTELLADEVIVAIRIGNNYNLGDLTSGLWVVNSTIMKKLKENAVDAIVKELETQKITITRNHSYFDICADGKSYVVFPNQQQLNTILNLHSNVICRDCKSKEVICVLTASEYLDETHNPPHNCRIKTMDIGIPALLT